MILANENFKVFSETCLKIIYETLFNYRRERFMSKKLYIGNLSFDVTEEELEKSFSQYGEVASVAIIKDSVSGRSKGFGFIEFADEASAKSAKEGMDGKELAGRTLKVDEAREQREQQRRPRDNDSGGYRPRGRF